MGLFGGISTYNYALQSPNRFIDPHGLNPLACAIPIVGPVCVAAGAAVLKGLAGGVAIAGALLTSGDSDNSSSIADDDGTCSLDDGDVCYLRWLEEDGRCNAWANLGPRPVAACRDPAACLRNLCVANGGKPNPLEPPEYSPFLDFPKISSLQVEREN